MTNKEFFDNIFPDEISNVEFFGTKEGISCIIYHSSGNHFSHKRYDNIYDAFKDAYECYKDIF